MQFITPKNHPEWVKPIEATSASIITAAQEAFEYIHEEPYRAITIHLPDDGITNTFNIAKQNSSIRLDGEQLKFANGKLYCAIEEEEKRISDAEIEILYGPAYLTMAKFCKELGAGGLQIRSTDANNVFSHIDSGYSNYRFNLFNKFEKVSNRAKSPEFGLTATMAFGRNGSELIEIHPDELTSPCVEKYALDDRPTWKWQQKHSLQGRTWGTHPNTITLMRSEAWGPKHLPCPHKASARKDDGNPNTGIVGVSFIYGRN